ncbi:aldehyde dehydrogenase family protein [Rhodocyclus tenuis]|uniref:Acyl-CoA reductase-like NAD-dependent aldehyde dehydrogenase n=1 Tax=Rhodocyclus tenuis TaxID=1066 RepID=A0A840FZC1_RHOTE|nr:aldehyde dehydrogenase family protein [Rhodocyclus tenuis]MBB4247467.1 acyl-CoA reductase-like NAD-dependent aldehyde dehydrogenase [Rhodocyclus tenuis]
MSGSHDALVIPLWIGGHAYLTMVQEFCEVRDAASGEVLRRTPLAGASEAQAAADAALQAKPAWAALAANERAAHCVAAAEVLAGYAEHFAGLIGAESGFDAATASAEIAAAVAALYGASAATDAVTAPGVLALVAGRGSPLAAPLARALPALLAGSALVFRPSPHEPSALFALAEVLAEAGLPGGVFNVVHGDEAAVAGLCSAAGIDAIACVGEAGFRERVAAIAARHGRSLLA